MDTITNKAITIAVGVFVTIIITSGILLAINQIKNVYQEVYETDTNITSRFSEFDAFDNTEKTGLEVANAINKYGFDNSSSVYVDVDSHSGDVSYWKNKEERISDGTYSKIYKSTIDIDENNDRVKINFKSK